MAAKARPQKIELGNAKLALYNVPPAKATVLAKWSDLQALSAYTGKDLVDLAAVATSQGDIPPSSIEAAALPLLLRGANVDATSLNIVGCATVAAVAALAAVDFSDSSVQVLIVGKTDVHLAAIKAKITGAAEAAKKKVSFAAPNAPQGQILIAPAEAVAGLERIPALKLVIVAELHAICTLPNVSPSVVAVASLPVQVLLLGSEVVLSHEDVTALKLRDSELD
ncbi:hypothetical protein T484DRAFT_1769264 [Baffinella frigidus]|nr:hypothetical protein T484DRAFT_1769264 [Cryptophyta sp. CCMP2293]